MELTPYVDIVRRGVTEASSLADEQTRQVADRLGGAIDSAARLAFIRVLSDAAASVSADLAPTSVDVRMNGDEPDLVVHVPGPEASPTLIMPRPVDPAPAPEAPDVAEVAEAGPDDEPTARISLRLPASVKTKVDEVADREGISTNAWLQRAIMDALGEPRPGRSAADSVRGLFGAVGPFGPDGPFGAHGVFGPHGPFGDGRPQRAEAWAPGAPPAPPVPAQPRGKVQGWVR